MDIMELGAIGELVGGVAVLLTLIYLAVPVRQSTAVQRQSARLAAGDAVQNSVGRFTAFRHLVANEGSGEVWAKARFDQELSAIEEIRLRAILQELAFAAVANIELYRATAGDSYLAGIPDAVAVELRGSNRLRDAWAAIMDELSLFGFADLADEVAARLEGSKSTIPVVG